jgi:hypothetical protein
VAVVVVRLLLVQRRLVIRAVRAVQARRRLSQAPRLRMRVVAVVVRSTQVLLVVLVAAAVVQVVWVL